MSLLLSIATALLLVAGPLALGAERPATTATNIVPSPIT